MEKEHLASIRETFGRAVYTHKTYEKAAEICTTKGNRVKYINIILLVSTSGSAIYNIFKPSLLATIIPILSSLSLFFAIYELSKNYNSEADSFKRTANKLWLIKEEYQNLIADVKSNSITKKKIILKRNAILIRLNEILESAPKTDNKAYTKAQKALKLNEEHTFTNKEINSFLPRELHTN